MKPTGTAEDKKKVSYANFVKFKSYSRRLGS